jgi:ABC-2 type transport system ATP-binding protein
MVEDMTHEPAIECLKLIKKYESFTAVDNLDLVVEKGQIYGFLGPNGAGVRYQLTMIRQ